eukprot:jgi/Botrbrau1/3836/Bobra.0183s0061.1
MPSERSWVRAFAGSSGNCRISAFCLSRLSNSRSRSMGVQGGSMKVVSLTGKKAALSAAPHLRDSGIRELHPCHILYFHAIRLARMVSACHCLEDPIRSVHQPIPFFAVR